MNGAELDFRLLFEESPDILLVLLPDAPRYTMVGATRARLEATSTTREQVVGRGLFELFPDNPDDPAATGATNLRASLDRVLATRAADTMAVQKYDIRGPDGQFEVKYWSPKNLPVLGADGQIAYILHRVEEVTELVRASEAGEELRGRTRAMENEVIVRSRELATANAELRAANAKAGELDQAKTAFFNNISHEFRTPLTLMLGPLEDGLADLEEPPSPRHRTRLKLAHDNSLRLLKLVNTLLDVSRLEAGRMQANYAPLDIGQFTAELAGMFQSATDKVGLKLQIDCPPLREPAWVDRDMWEKIVPNLVSNAFKFTMQGEIAVRVREEPARVVLEVADSGVGIPEAELPRIFDRFHRVAGSAGRTYEGTGIGLSLVHELVRLHGGQVAVDSEVGRGTTFRVVIPKGFAHLPPAAVSQIPVEAGGARVAIAHAAEVARWQTSSEGVSSDGASADPTPAADPAGAAGPATTDSSTPRASVLIVDDNADLRHYMATLLSRTHDVRTAVDGQAGLEAARAHPPDIVLSDVMMPRLDGFGLVRALRADKRTASLPVVLLSARAGEEATVEGLDAGADDYLVKPFSARELLARVRTHVNLARSRQAWIAELERINRELDTFSYSVSHDLRAPLRAIGGFSQMLAEDYAAVLDARGKGYLTRIGKGVARMGTLIEDLLMLARISRGQINGTAVDLSVLAAEVVAELRTAHPDRAVEVDIEAGLGTWGDRRLLNVVLVNLIGNAWKFTSRRPDGRIRIGRRPGDPSTFFVRDNGAGFDMTYAANLFAPFQRLHRADEFEGTGIGLATVQRVVGRHGGSIWAEAAVGEGATFFFSLPGPAARMAPLVPVAPAGPAEEQRIAAPSP